MTTFILTPKFDDLNTTYLIERKDGVYEIPIVKFNLNSDYIPIYPAVDYLNEDRLYQKRVIDNFYTRLTERWLYKSHYFEKLLKYFKVNVDSDEGMVSIIKNPDDFQKSSENIKYKKYIFEFIENTFITRKFVSRVIRNFVDYNHVKWYDLFHITDEIKKLLAKKLNTRISDFIYELHDQLEILKK